jgi:hypothetical protein
MPRLSAKSLEFSTRHEYSHGPPSACQFHINSRLRFIDEAGEA